MKFKTLSTNIALISISVIELACLLNMLTNLETFTFTSSAFRFVSISVTNFCPYQLIITGASLTLTNHGRFILKKCCVFLIRCKKYLRVIELPENPLATDDTLYIKYQLILNPMVTFIIKPLFP